MYVIIQSVEKVVSLHTVCYSYHRETEGHVTSFWTGLVRKLVSTEYILAMAIVMKSHKSEHDFHLLLRQGK